MNPINCIVALIVLGAVMAYVLPGDARRDLALAAAIDPGFYCMTDDPEAQVYAPGRKIEHLVLVIRSDTKRQALVDAGALVLCAKDA